MYTVMPQHEPFLTNWPGKTLAGFVVSVFRLLGPSTQWKRKNPGGEIIDFAVVWPRTASQQALLQRLSSSAAQVPRATPGEVEPRILLILP